MNVLAGITNPKWSRNLPNKACPGSSDTNCHYSSPVLADLTGDGKLEIIVTTNNGFIVAVRHDGSLLWERDVAPHFGMSPGTNEIASSPAVADIDQDGFPDIVVGVGTLFGNVCTHGGVIALDHNGNVKPGWPQLSYGQNSNGCHRTIFSTPALGDLNNDGYLEIIAGGFDKRIYAWQHNGQIVNGFPVDSHHLQRFPDWNFTGILADSIWGSPALADLNGDGYLDIVIGTDEGNFDGRWGGDAGGWSCPYTLPPGWAPGYCGGALYAVDRFGKILPGFPRFFLEIIQSTPAIVDVNNDGIPEIFVGTGTFYHDHSPDRPTHGFRLYGLNNQGHDLPGWEGGKVVGGLTPASPAVGDISGDNNLEIVVAASDKKLYAWHHNGQSVGGFPMTPRDHNANTLGSYGAGMSFALADYSGNGKMEIFFNQAWTVIIVDGAGQQLTATNFPNNSLPIYYAHGTLLNTPAVGDLNGNGRLELVASNSQLFAWELPNSSPKADWPMFKQNAARTSAIPSLPRLQINPDALFLMHQSGQGGNAQTTMSLQNTGGGFLNWSISRPPGITVSPSSGSISAGSSQSVVVTVHASSYGDGTHFLGSLSITGEGNNDSPALNSPASTPITLYVGEISRLFLPVIQR